MSRRDWKNARASSFAEALRLCKDFALERKRLSVERIAALMGQSSDSIYKWLATGRFPGNLLPAYEHVCGCHYASDWLSASAGRLVIDMPTGRRVTEKDVLALNTSLAAALPTLKDFYASKAPSQADVEATLAALRHHMEQAAFHHRNVAQYVAPELEF